jgi:hypothetical protein
VERPCQADDILWLIQEEDSPIESHQKLTQVHREERKKADGAESLRKSPEASQGQVHFQRLEETSS